LSTCSVSVRSFHCLGLWRAVAGYTNSNFRARKATFPSLCHLLFQSTDWQGFSSTPLSVEDLLVFCFLSINSLLTLFIEIFSASFLNSLLLFPAQRSCHSVARFPPSTSGNTERVLKHRDIFTLSHILDFHTPRLRTLQDVVLQRI